MMSEADQTPDSGRKLSRSSTSHTLQYSGPGEALPPGAVLLSPVQVADMQRKLIRDWKPKRAMWSLNYGPHTMGALAGLGGLYFISHFRTAMHLRHHARIASLIPSVFFPSMVTTVGHVLLVVEPIKSGQLVCPVCVQLRAISIQVFAGVIQPFVLSALAASALARTAYTYALPPISDWRALWGVYARLSRPIQGPGLALLALSVVSAVSVTWTEGRAAEKLHQALADRDTFVP